MLAAKVKKPPPKYVLNGRQRWYVGQVNLIVEFGALVHCTFFVPWHRILLGVIGRLDLQNVMDN